MEIEKYPCLSLDCSCIVKTKKLIQLPRATLSFTVLLQLVETTCSKLVDKF